MTDQTIATIPKNGREDIRISIRDFGGRKAVDIRVFVESGEGRKASPKGIAVKPELVRALIEGLQEAEKTAVVERLSGEPNKPLQAGRGAPTR